MQHEPSQTPVQRGEIVNHILTILSPPSNQHKLLHLIHRAVVLQDIVSILPDGICIKLRSSSSSQPAESSPDATESSSVFNLLKSDMAFLGDGRLTASKQGGDNGKRMLAGIVAALAEEAACNIMSKDEGLAGFSILVTRESGVICAARDPFWSRFCVAYPPCEHLSHVYVKRGNEGLRWHGIIVIR